jgi:hypothetical protein
MQDLFDKLLIFKNSRSHYVAQSGLELIIYMLCISGWPQTPEPPASASQVLGFQEYTTTQKSSHFLIF